MDDGLHHQRAMNDGMHFIILYIARMVGWVGWGYYNEKIAFDETVALCLNGY